MEALTIMGGNSMLKRITAVVITTVMVLSLAVTSLAYSTNVSVQAQSSVNVHSQNIPAGSYTGRVGVNSMTCTVPNPKLKTTLSGPGFTVVSTSFTSAGSTTQGYSLAGLTQMKFSVKNQCSGRIDANVTWDYNY